VRRVEEARYLGSDTILIRFMDLCAIAVAVRPFVMLDTVGLQERRASKAGKERSDSEGALFGSGDRGVVASHHRSQAFDPCQHLARIIGEEIRVLEQPLSSEQWWTSSLSSRSVI